LFGVSRYLFPLKPRGVWPNWLIPQKKAKFLLARTACVVLGIIYKFSSPIGYAVIPLK
jgi:hypothetical protein